MKESLKDKIRRYTLQGWVDKPAYARAFLWFILGIILGIIIK